MMIPFSPFSAPAAYFLPLSWVIRNGSPSIKVREVDNFRDNTKSVYQAANDPI